MAHKEKFNAQQSAAIFSHFDRTRYENHKHRVRGGEKNYDLPNSKTCKNYNLAADVQPLPQSDFMKKRISEVKHINRADVVTSVDWVVTLPEDVHKKDERAFFEASFDFLCNRYGSQNVISAYVHKDEVTPHLHFAFVPVQRLKNGSEKLNAKGVVSLSDLRTFHADLSKSVEKRLGYHCSILNGATADGNESIAELKRGTKTVKKQYNRAARQRDEAIQERDEAYFEAENHLETARVDLSEEVPADAKIRRKGLFRRQETVEVTREQWNNHAASPETAERIEKAVKWYEDTSTGKALEEAKQLVKNREIDVTFYLNSFLAEKDENESLKEQLSHEKYRNADLERENKALRRKVEAFERSVKHFDERSQEAILQAYRFEQNQNSNGGNSL